MPVRPVRPGGEPPIGGPSGHVSSRATDQQVVASIKSSADIVCARERGRALAGQLGFPARDRVLVATVISELARNIVLYAGRGQICIGPVYRDAARGLTVVARDSGPGIVSLERALKDGYSTSGGLGLGLPGVRRLVDDFDIQSRPGLGTVVTATIWVEGNDHEDE